MVTKMSDTKNVRSPAVLVVSKVLLLSAVAIYMPSVSTSVGGGTFLREELARLGEFNA